MADRELSDAQWLVLDLLVRAREAGVQRLSRQELLANESVPATLRIRLAFAALMMPSDVVRWIGEHEFEITDAGAEVFNQRYKRASRMADIIIYLPDRSHEVPN